MKSAADRDRRGSDIPVASDLRSRAQALDERLAIDR